MEYICWSRYKLWYESG